MKNGLVWLVVSCLMVAALVLASCAAAEEEEEEVVTVGEEEEVVTPEEEEVVAAEEKEMVRDSLDRLVEKPHYGGVFNDVISSSPYRFDEASIHVAWTPTLHLTNEELFEGDWTKGPTGTGEGSWAYIMFPPPDLREPILAESWELADANTIVYHIRKGVHWHNKPPVNGREMTADDVVFTLNRLWDIPMSYHCTAYPREENIVSITAPDKWTVVIECVPGRTGHIYKMTSDHCKIVPPEPIEMYGDLSDWRNSVGTGPFILVDYVDGSAVTFERNPNYWRKHPLYSEDTMPYLDGVKWLIIPDASTRMAAMRTGKIDCLGLGWENAEEIMRTSPQLQHVTYLTGSASALFMRVDAPPLDDVRVRRALSMAIDRQDMIDTIYGGNAEVITWPVGPIPEWGDMFVPIDEMPESVREQFEYHPDRAKQLLAEAGYPEGFQTEIVCISGAADLLSIVKAYWEDIGVDLKIDVKDTTVYTSIGYRKTHKQMYYYGVTSTLPFTFIRVLPGMQHNYSMVDDPVITETYEAISEAFFDEPLRRQLMKEFVPYLLDLACVVQLPGGYSYIFWQPWVKSYSGELQIGYMNNNDFHKYIWLDQDLKEEMTGRR